MQAHRKHNSFVVLLVLSTALLLAVIIIAAQDSTAGVYGKEAVIHRVKVDTHKHTPTTFYDEHSLAILASVAALLGGLSLAGVLGCFKSAAYSLPKATLKDTAEAWKSRGE